MKLPKKQQNSFTAKTQKDVSKEWKISSLLKNAGRDNSLDPSPVSLSGSPSSIEVMRCQCHFFLLIEYLDDFPGPFYIISLCENTIWRLILGGIFKISTSQNFIFMLVNASNLVLLRLVGNNITVTLKLGS